MKTCLYIAWYTIRDVARSRWSLLYTVFFGIITLGLIQFQADSSKVAVSLISVCLILIPLVSTLFGTVYCYNSREFVELTLTQPVARRTVFLGLYAGLAFSLLLGFALGVGVPFLLFGARALEQFFSLLSLLLIGSFLTVIFLAMSFLVAIRFDDRGKGLTVALGLWLFTALIYDGLVLSAASAFSDYPLEMPLLLLSLANPIDLARVTMLVQSDMAALMGYTGAVFSRFFDSSTGLTVSNLALALWTSLPLAAGMRSFHKKDF